MRGRPDLAVPADLERAVLSYNHSADYLRTVLSWLDFYRRGTHTVPDGKGALPSTPGAGSAGQMDADHGRKQGGGIVIGPQPGGVRPSASVPTPPVGSPTSSLPPHPPSASPVPLRLRFAVPLGFAFVVRGPRSVSVALAL